MQQQILSQQLWNSMGKEPGDRSYVLCQASLLTGYLVTAEDRFQCSPSCDPKYITPKNVTHYKTAAYSKQRENHSTVNVTQCSVQYSPRRAYLVHDWGQSWICCVCEWKELKPPLESTVLKTNWWPCGNLMHTEYGPRIHLNTQKVLKSISLMYIII